MCLFFLLASVALLLYPAKRETMFLRRLRYIPHMFLFRPHMFLFRMVAFEKSVCFCYRWFTSIVPPQVGRLTSVMFLVHFYRSSTSGQASASVMFLVHFYRSSTSGQASVYVFLFLGPLSLEFRLTYSQLNSVLLFYLTQTCKILLCTKFHAEVLL